MVGESGGAPAHGAQHLDLGFLVLLLMFRGLRQTLSQNRQYLLGENRFRHAGRGLLCRTLGVHGGQVGGDGAGEGLRGGEQPLLQQGRDEVDRVPAGPSHTEATAVRVLDQRSVRSTFGFVVVHFGVTEHPLGETGAAVPTLGQVPLEAANHGAIQLFVGGFDPAGETLVVQQLQEGGERLRVAVVRGGGEEEPMFAVGGELPDRLGTQGIDRVLSATGRGHVVCFVHHQQVDGARVAGVGGQDLAQHTSGAFAFEPVDADDQARVVGPGVGVQAAFAT